MRASFSAAEPSQIRMRSGEVIAAISSTHLRMPGWVNPAFSLIRPILLANSREAIARHRERREDRFDLFARWLEPRRQHERLAEMRRILVNRESRTFGRDLEQHAARFLEIYRFEPETIDHVGRAAAPRFDLRAHRQLVLE